MKITYQNSDDNRVERYDASIPDVLEIVAKLNDTDATYIHTWKNEIQLSVIGGHRERVIVLYIPYGRLVDPNYGEQSGNIRMKVTDGTVDTHPIYQTVTKEKALEVVQYILEHETPPKGLTWWQSGELTSS